MHVLVNSTLYFLMTNSQKIEYASVDIETTCPKVIDGQVRFLQFTQNYILKDFIIPVSINNDKELNRYLSELLYKSDCDIASIRDVYVREWNEV